MDPVVGVIDAVARIVAVGVTGVLAVGVSGAMVAVAEPDNPARAVGMAVPTRRRCWAVLATRSSARSLSRAGPATAGPENLRPNGRDQQQSEEGGDGGFHGYKARCPTRRRSQGFH